MKQRVVVLLAVAALALVAVYPIAVADEGRTSGATPGAPTGSVVEPGGDTGADGDSVQAANRGGDFVILNDLIVDGSACIGIDCVNGETFGFDTLRLKENNLRIDFTDTSTAASFPTEDWTIVANDSANGGDNAFYITSDGPAGSGQRLFWLAAGAPVWSFKMDSQGDIGLGTGNPVLELHIADGDTPSIRLEQTGASGFTPQTWDVAGNEANFFVRDATSGSTLPFKIKPGAPSDQLVVTPTGVGIGTVSPAEKLHIKNTATQIKFLLENSVEQWSFTVASDGSMRISAQGTGGPEFEILSNGTVNMGFGGADHLVVDPSGNVTISGNTTVNGDLTVNGGGGCTGC